MRTKLVDQQAPAENVPQGRHKAAETEQMQVKAWSCNLLEFGVGGVWCVPSCSTPDTERDVFDRII